MRTPVPALPPLRDVIARHGLAASKALGQNFLLDEQLLDRIAAVPGELDGQDVLEIGPGPGGLTRALLAAGARTIQLRRKNAEPAAWLATAREVVADCRANDAVCIVNDSVFDRTLEKILSRQKDSGITVSAPILEINPSHALIRALAAQVKAKGASSVEDAAQLLLDQAFIIEGEQVPDPAGFAKRLADVMAKAFG